MATGATAGVWLLAAPSGGPGGGADAAARLREALAVKPQELADFAQVQLPSFKVGTLDSLIVLSDELAKADQTAEAVINKIADGLRNLLNSDMDQWKANIVVGDKRIETYLKTFQWNSMKYRSDRTLKEVLDSINQEIASIDTLMKNKSQAYSQVRSTLQALQRKTTGNLAVRSLNDVVKKDHFVLDSEYLATILVAVPKASMKDWIDEYETITQMVVPRSTQKVAEDDEYALFTVTLFQRVVDEFSNKAREKKYIVRDFKWDPELLSKEKKELTETTASEREQWGTMLRLSKTNFGELYSSWIHMKALRVFVESVLRYGLPPDFQTMFVFAKPKQEKRVRDIFNKHYAYLDKSMPQGGSAADEAIDENLQLLMGEKDYCPAVLFAVNTIV